MERVIKFRGKSKFTGEWHYGHYHFGVMYPNDRANHYIDNEIIDVNALGQLIGFNDGGFPIYEGDISYFKYLIFYNESKCLFAEHFKQRFTGEYALAAYPIDLGRIEIIGNIHDNPELLA